MQLTPALVPAALALTLTAPASPRADLAYHGAITLARDHVTVAVTPQNHGPSDVPDATVRLTWSTRLADPQALPAPCLRTGPRAVVCRTGALPAAGLGDPFTVDVRLVTAPTEVTVRLDTAFGAGTVDHNPENNRHRVLVLDTGDPYYF